MPDVELDPDRVAADLVDQLGRLAERVEIDQFSTPSRWNGSSASRTPALSASRASVRSPSTTIARASPGSRSPAGPVKQSTADGLEPREPVHRGAERGDPLPRILRAGQQRQRQDRRDGGDRRRRAEPARGKLLARLLVRSLAELQLPDADPVDAGVRVRAQVVGEARGERAHLRDRDQRQLLRGPSTPGAVIVSRI